MEPRPIDKTKRSNRRCINCAHHPCKADPYGLKTCQKTGRAVNYWNCCKNFEWNPDKLYKTPD